MWKPGESGNPKGRPKKLPGLDDLLLDVLSPTQDINRSKAVVEALVKRAEKGDIRAIEVLMERIWGKAKQQIEVSNPVEQYFLIGDQKLKFG